MILATDLSREFVTEAEVVRAVDQVNFSARAGEYICVFGFSGSGKTTLLNLFAGIDLPTSGGVAVLDNDLASLNEDGRIRLRREIVGMVHQTDALVEEFTALENVMLPLEAGGTSSTIAGPAAEDALATVGMQGWEHRFPRQLSGGQRQRVGIARALVGGRQILLADEPTGSLDSSNSAKIFELIRHLCDRGMLAIVASHDPACRRFASRHVEMFDGTIKADNPP